MDSPSDIDENSQIGLLTDISDDVDEPNRSVGDIVDAEYYELLTTSDLFHEMKNDIAKVSTVLCVSEATAKCLLNKFEWNIEKLLDRYCECPDLNSFLLSWTIENFRSRISTPVAESITECEICFNPLAEGKLVNFHCGHRFCENCCSRYLEAKVLNDGKGNEIECPNADCKMLIDDTNVMELIPENAKHRLVSLVARALIGSNPLLRYCQSEDCEYIVKAKSIMRPVPVTCKCGFESCLQCGEIWHESITCALLRKLIRICVDRTGLIRIRCPRCLCSVTENRLWDDLNYVQCDACSYQFCRVCRHDWHKDSDGCEKFTVRMYLNGYNERYINQMQSLKLERKIYDSIVRETFFSISSKEIADTTLKCAFDSLRRSRQILISTYAITCISEDSNQLNIFVRNQNDLEQATEKLSLILQQLKVEISKQRWVDIKQKLEEKYGYCDKRQRVLLDHVNEGYEKGYWSR